MNATVVGMATGALLAVVGLTLGAWAFVVVAVCIVLGAVVARILTGTLDLRRLLDVLRGRRSSS